MAVTIAAAKHFLNGAGAVRVHGGTVSTVQAFVPLELDAFKAEMEAILGTGKCHITLHPSGRRCRAVISTAIQQLVNYGLDTWLITDDEIHTTSCW